MGTISDKLMRVINTKEDIRKALISKGYDVPTSIPFKEYAKMILDLPCKIDDFPELPGDVTRWHFGGLTNEMMAAMDDPRIEDADGKGRFLSFKNFAWGGMSGAGGVSTYYDKYEFTPDKYYMVAVSSGTQHAQFTFKVTGLVDGNSLSLSDTSSPSNVYGKWTQDGIYTVDIDVINTNRSLYFYNGVSATRGEFTIEILPLYPGFILGDGVDDFAVTEKELNFEDTYTVYTAFIPFQDDPARNMILCGKNDTKDFAINYSGTHLNFKPSTGVNLAVRIDQFALLVCKRNKDITTIINLSTGESRSLKSVEFISNPGLYYLWRNVFATFHARAAIAGQTICNGYYSTDEDDEKVLDWYKKQYPWLFPNQAWTVVGKTNEDEDRATIANITGNGNDLILSNFGFAEGSGYNEEGEYAGYLVTDGVDDKAVSKQFKFGENFTVILDFKFPVKKISYCGFDLSSKVRIQNLQDSGVYVVLKGNKTLIPSNVVRAVTSEGKVYDENWNEYNIVPGNISSNYTMVNLGFDGSTQFAESATKLAGIYSSTLSKDDCIKAYNYLQTLKSK